MWDLIVSVPDHCLSFYFSVICWHKMTRHWKYTDNILLLNTEIICFFHKGKYSLYMQCVSVHTWNNLCV